jgi:beta-mannosidase
MQPVAATITDEGVNGLHVHVANDRACEVQGEVRVTLYRDGATCVASGTAPFVVPARGAAFVNVDAVLGRFHDVSYAYRFGAAGHDLVVATFTDASGVRIAEAFHFPLGAPSAQHADTALSATAERRDDGAVTLLVCAERFAQSIAVDGGAAVPDDNYFHVAPGDARLVTFSAAETAHLSEVFVHPLNAQTGLRVAIPRMMSVRA